MRTHTHSIGHRSYYDLPHLTATAQVKTRLNDMIATITHLREDASAAKDANAKALFETTREVLKDLVAAVELYEQKTMQVS